MSNSSTVTFQISYAPYKAISSQHSQSKSEENTKKDLCAITFSLGTTRHTLLVFVDIFLFTLRSINFVG